LSKVAIAVGSNVGDREAHVGYAAARLGDFLSNLSPSRWFETAPVGVGEQDPFLNGAIVGETALSPRQLLDVLLLIERERGRARPHPGAPRTLDLDLILYDRQVVDEPGLQVPHPRFRDRLFVLDPLAEIAADWIDPETGLSIRALRDRLRQRERAER
jgi:2-amino-4-hydroxy-6-hydroxymethyldihydropteridine diphosphokinase